MARGKQPARASDFRVWLLRCGANPAVIPELLSCAALSSMPDWGLGDTERSECPDPSSYAGFVVYDEIPGAVDNAKIGVKMKYARDLAPLLAFARTRQIADIQLLMGRCNSPEEYTKFDKILVLTYAKPTKWAADKITAMQSGDNGSSEEMIDLSGVEFYEIVPLTFSSPLAPTLVTREVTGIDICDSPNCEDVPCPTPCQVVVAVQIGDGAALKPAVIYTDGTTWASEDVTTMTFAETPSDIICMGDYVVVLDSTGNSYHYTTLESLLAGAPVWTEKTTGFVALKLPNKGVYISGTLYIAANAGYIYRVRSAGSAAVAVEAGVATAQNLNEIDAIDTHHIVAVGDSNVVLSSDDGVNFDLIVGPIIGQNLMSVCMLDVNTWLVGAANGKLYSTLNGGATWAEKALPVGLDAVDDIKHVGGVIYLTGVETDSGSGVILRNTAGGTDAMSAWYVLPEGTGAISTNQGIHDLAVCQSDYNLVYGAGLGLITDGIIVRATP